MCKLTTEYAVDHANPCPEEGCGCARMCFRADCKCNAKYHGCKDRRSYEVEAFMGAPFASSFTEIPAKALENKCTIKIVLGSTSYIPESVQKAPVSVLVTSPGPVIEEVEVKAMKQRVIEARKKYPE